jgi:hypothetical protein
MNSQLPTFFQEGDKASPAWLRVMPLSVIPAKDAGLTKVKKMNNENESKKIGRNQLRIILPSKSVLPKKRVIFQ